jgi:Amt family ammonium transporter
VSGLVAITPAAGFVSPLPAIVIGLAAGLLCAWAVGLKFRFGYDDSLDVVGVHLVGGIVGALLTGVFADLAVNSAGADGLLNGGGFTLLGKQLVAVSTTILFSGAMSLGILKLVDAVVGLRVTEEDEVSGIDLTQHAEVGYAFSEGGTLASHHSTPAPAMSHSPVPVPKGSEA